MGAVLPSASYVAADGMISGLRCPVLADSFVTSLCLCWKAEMAAVSNEILFGHFVRPVLSFK